MVSPKIGQVLQGARVQLERQAVNTFGAAVSDFARQGVSRLTGIAPEQLGPGSDVEGEWRATSYASAYSGATDFRPKLKFLFKVEFKFKAMPEFDSFLAANGIKDNQFTFMIKSVDRPKVDYEYDEDVNMYNFRTKVLKRIRHRELTMTFMDDVGNRVFNFFRLMMAIQSPVTRRSLRGPGENTNMFEAIYQSPKNGMVFTTGPTGNVVEDYAHRGVLNTDVGSAIERIRVRQIFVNPSKNDTGNPVKEVWFDFINPRVVSFDLDDLTHETSDVNLLTMQFDYDWMELGEGFKTGLQNNPGPIYPNVGTGNAPSDISIPRAGGGGPAPGLADGIGGILRNAAQRASQEVVSSTVNRALRGLPAGFGAIVGNAAGQAAGSAVGILTTNATNTISGARPASLISALQKSFNPTPTGYTPPPGGAE